MIDELIGRIKRASALIGAAALLAAAGQAQAISYVGRWDPAFGPPFTQLGWRGEARFEIPDACVALSGTVTVTNSSPCASGGLKMLDADVEFYNLADPGTVLDTLSFAMPSVVASMTVSGNALAAVVGGFLLPAHSALNIAGGDTDFWLNFIELGGSNYAQLDFVQYISCGEEPADRCIVATGKSQIGPGGPLMTFFVVPEPGILALLLPALGLLAVARRRRTTS